MLASAMTPPTKTPRAEAQIDTRDRLIASAVELMAEHGSVDKVTLRSVASGAGVSPTAVYRHFADHEALLAEATRWCWAQFDEAINGESESIDDPFDALRAQCDSYLRFAAEQPGVYRVLFSTVGSVGNVREEVGLPVFLKLVDSIGAVLDVVGDERIPVRVAMAAFSWIHGVADLRLTGVTLPFTEPDDEIGDMLEMLGLEQR